MKLRNGVIGTAIATALWVLLIADAMVVVHDFYTYADRAVYAAVDDGEANIAYSLATLGRYGFPASPVLEGMSRMHGQFNYGPWYFYLAAGLIWIFGYSLTLVRSIHLWVIVSCAAAAMVWFRGGRDRASAGAIVGLGVLFFFVSTEWPMVRPDSLVTAFAVLLTIAAGLGFERRQPIYWFVAGFAAACGAFTHLIAASLVLSSVALFGVYAVEGYYDAPDQTAAASLIVKDAIALGAGIALGAAMFYASFGFGFATQWRFLTGYRQLSATGEGYFATVIHHFKVAFGYYPAGLQQAVWATLAIAWLVTVAALRSRAANRRVVFARVLPPATIWTLYLISNGKYTNYHTGYAILHHVMFLWTAAAIIWAVCEIVGTRRPALAALIGTLAAVPVSAQGLRQLTSHVDDPTRALQAEHRVAFSDYADRVISAVPFNARAWGSVFFGIESPDRVQLIQHSDATALMQGISPADRTSLAPDYLIWSYPEVRDEALAALAGAPSRVAAMEQLLPEGHFHVVSLVDGKPYGVTRIYARSVRPGDADSPAPAVAMYDDVHRQWLTRMGPALPIEFRAEAPLTLHIGDEAAPGAQKATATVVADAPPGRYWLKITIRSGPGRAARLIAVTPWTMTRQPTSEMHLRPAGDFSGYLQADRQVFALIAHPGGALFVSQFDSSSDARIEGVTIGRVVDVPEARPVPGTPLPDFTSWIPMPGVKMILASGRLRVEGDASSSSYQLYSPMIPAAPGELVEVDVPSTLDRGSVCVGVLNGAGRWLVVADEWREQIDFRGDASRGFRVAFANCQFSGEPQPSRFSLAPGTYTRWGTALYADQLVAHGLGHSAAVTDVPPWRPPVEFPSQPLIVVRSTRSDNGFLFHADPRYLDTETRLLVAGHLQKGSLSIGLLRSGDWASRLNVAEPGEFVAMLAPASNGTYAVAVAGEAAGTALDRVWLLPAVRPAK